MRIGRDYLEWAHGEAPSEGAAMIRRAMYGRRMVTLDLTDDAVRAELLSCAKLYDHPETTTHAPNHRRTAARIVRALA